MDRDYNLCILCGRCWRICEKIHGKPAISIINRGKWARIGTAFDKSHLYSGCTFCGACIDICPTGTLTDRFARWHGKPETETQSTCILCSEGCSVVAQSKSGQLLANIMTGFGIEDGLCALGRFGSAQIVASSRRLIRPAVREGEDGQIAIDWEGAIQAAAEGLRAAMGATAIVVSGATSREDRFLYGRLAEHLQGSLLVLPTSAGSENAQVQTLTEAARRGAIRAVITNGDLVPVELLQAVHFSLVIDCLPSKVSSEATVVLPAAVLSETSGTFRTSSGVIKTMAIASQAPGDSRPEWAILSLLGQELGWPDTHRNAVEAVTPLITNDPAPEIFAGHPRQNVRQLPIRFRGHLLADIIPALEAFEMPKSPVAAKIEPAGEGFAILEKREIVPNMHFFRIKAPQVAKFARPGQFVILMAGETSERSPFTLVDWDAAEGSITLVIEEVGRSSRELATLRAGDSIAHVSGPLGLPLPIEKKGTILLGGGCYGIGAIYPIARALRQAGNRVICTIEASSSYLLYRVEELRAVCDELILATKDGSTGVWGGVQDVVSQLVRDGRSLDQFIVIGCTFMMRMAAEASRPFGIPTLVALNPIMVDGTGMCGACRVTVADQTRFACIDGPIFDGHNIDWDELASRRSAYARQEVQALSQTVDLNALVHRPESHGCGCGRK